MNNKLLLGLVGLLGCSNPCPEQKSIFSMVEHYCPQYQSKKIELAIQDSLEELKRKKGYARVDQLGDASLMNEECVRLFASFTYGPSCNSEENKYLVIGYEQSFDKKRFCHVFDYSCIYEGKSLIKRLLDQGKRNNRAAIPERVNDEQ